MGESSPKSLRGGGMDDVIFAGTATAPRAISPRSRSLDRDAAEDGARNESEVTRRIERAPAPPIGSTAATFAPRTLSLLFADAATGAHSPALVSQGKIGAVIAAKPVERRLLLEEAAGISGLHARRKDAEQKLRAAEANLARARRNLKRPGTACCSAPASGPGGRTLSQAHRADPLGRGASCFMPGGSRPSALRGCERGSAQRPAKTWLESGPRSPRLKAAQERANGACGASKCAGRASRTGS